MYLSVHFQQLQYSSQKNYCQQSSMSVGLNISLISSPLLHIRTHNTVIIRNSSSQLSQSRPINRNLPLPVHWKTIFSSKSNRGNGSKKQTFILSYDADTRFWFTKIQFGERQDAQLRSNNNSLIKRIKDCYHYHLIKSDMSHKQSKNANFYTSDNSHHKQ